MKRTATVGRRLALAAALAGGAFLLSTGYGSAVAADDAVGVEAAAQDDEKKKRKAEKKAAARAAKEQKRLERQRRQRGRTVRAVVVPSEPAAGSEPAAAPAAEPAVASAPEPVPAPKVAPEPVAEPKTEPARAAAVEPVRTRQPAPEPEQPRAARPAPAVAPARDISLDERIRVAEVLLDVLVTDRKGNVIEGLGAEDFVVLHDGEEQEVTSASFYGGPSELSATGDGGTARTDRYFILMFHDQRMQSPRLAGPQMDNARWLKRWIEEELQPNDQVAVFAYQARLKVYLDFTRDRDEILAAVDAASRGKKDLEPWVTRSEPEFDPNSPSLIVNLPAGKELARRSRKLQQALELLGEAASGIAGRKNMVMFSLGFGAGTRGYRDIKVRVRDGNYKVRSRTGFRYGESAGP